MLIIGVSLIIAGNFIINKLESMELIHGALTKYSLIPVNWLIILLLFFSVISTLYYFGPATAKKFRFFSAGATLATVLSIVSSSGFAFYLQASDYLFCK